MPVDSLHPQYSASAATWIRCRDCYNGSDAVKLAGTKYLPMLAGHVKDPKKYSEYALRALFYNATGRTVDGLSGAIFQRAPQVKFTREDDLEDITLTGVSLELFGLHATRELLKTGRYGILIEMPETGEDLRPYWVGYCAEEILNWRTQRINGRQVVTLVVLKETRATSKPGDIFTDDIEDVIRVLSLNELGVYTQQLWRKKSNESTYVADADVIIPMRRGAPLTEVPFIFLGPTDITPDVQKPPLLDLVDVNLSHFRTMADLEHGRHFTALPTPWVAGLSVDSGDVLEIGSGGAWVLDKEGRAGMLEFTGQGLGALERAEQEKRKMMATLGARLLEDQPASPETGMAVAMRHAGEHATLRTVTQVIETGLTFGLQRHAWWMGTEDKPVATDVKAELNKDFFAVRITPAELQSLVQALQADAISYKTFYAALQRGELARPGVDADEEQEEISKQADEGMSGDGPNPAGEPNDGSTPGDGQTLPVPGAQRNPGATPPPPPAKPGDPAQKPK